jgi:crotonobetaine/carnitine-CoA ligase
MSARPKLHPPVHALLEHQAATRPDAVFLRNGEEALTFAQADREVRRLAGGLARQGIAGGDSVAMMLPNGIDFVLAWVACARLGALSVFVNPTYRADLLDYVLNDCAPKALVTHPDIEASLAAALVPALARIEWMGVAGAGIHAAAVGALPRRVPLSSLQTAEDTAPAPANDARVPNCVIYTSGTTGASKGAVLSTAALLAGAQTFVDLAELTERDVLYTPLPLFHGLASRQGVMGCLIAGAQVAIGQRFSASRFWDEVCDTGATIAHTMFNIPAMLKAQPPHPRERSHRLRFMYNAGHDAAFEERFNVPLLESYGLVETGITIYSPFSQRKPGSCGRLHPEWEARIADPDGNELPDGEVGELLQRPRRQHLFMDGYLGKPAATLNACKDFWFHTGDFLFREADGHYYFAGRQKERIRRRGENISAFEIERVMMQHADVRLCAAMGYPAEVGDDDVRLVLMLREGAPFEPAALARWAAERLPAFMVPRYFEAAESLPLTPTKKVRKHELIERGFGRHVWDRERSAWLEPAP